ncbi:venom serine carboxypeptidase-like [Chrysoperla carnea]|uniref:venom serine carboxypeptidase-like n=1 Tax=Chrysoperla carnea TaxID=189513 RepID=UPI001D0661C1|nr:venom serine carboxypeptidase-like [Chrysoperla carnea]
MLIGYIAFEIRMSTTPPPDYGEPLYLTPLLDDNISKAKELSKVNLKLSYGSEIESYAGLFTVNKKYNSTLFHWYFVAEEQPKTAPLLLWLNGGPGATSLFGLFQQHGPFQVNKDIELEKREYYWTKNHHVIYLDNPVGTGFSYTDSDEGYSKNTEDISKNLLEALEQFFKMWPNLKKNDFYLTSESYGGKYLPNLGNLIIQEGKFENFKGVAIGNGYIVPEDQVHGFGEYLYQQGFIDTSTKDVFIKKEKQCSKIIKLINQKKYIPEKRTNALPCLEIVDPSTNNSLFGNATGYGYVYNILKSRPPVEDNLRLELYLQKASVRKSIHVGKLKRYAHSNDQIKVRQNLGRSIFKSEKKHLEELLAKNYRVLIYSGQLDVIFPYVAAVNYLKTLDFEYMDEYNQAPRLIWKVDDDVAGYIKSAGPLTEVMVIGAGHMVPMDQPKRAWDLITKFTRNKFPT